MLSRANRGFEIGKGRIAEQRSDRETGPATSKFFGSRVKVKWVPTGTVVK